MTTFEIIRDLGLLTIGGFGAILSLVNYYHLKAKDRKKVKVRVRTVMVTYETGKIGEPYLEIMAINNGHRPINIENISLELGKGRSLQYMYPDTGSPFEDSRLPTLLGDGDSVKKFYKYHHVDETIRDLKFWWWARVTPYATDAEGIRHKGEPIKWKLPKRKKA